MEGDLSKHAGMLMKSIHYRAHTCMCVCVCVCVYVCVCVCLFTSFFLQTCSQTNSVCQHVYPAYHCQEITSGWFFKSDKTVSVYSIVMQPLCV